jgi:hypothetical protein
MKGKGLSKIIESINNLIEKSRAPFIPIPAIILACGVFKRPGISAMIIASNIIKRQSEFGAPTGILPDGSTNKMNSLIYIMTEEIIKELQKNCVIESVIPAGTIEIQGMGANAGGPVTIKATNTKAVKATGIPR